MEFDKSRVYTALNADELKVGSKVIVADTYRNLIFFVEDEPANFPPVVITEILDDSHMCRFLYENNANRACALAYLISEPEEKKLKWTDLKIGDVIRKGIETYMVIGIEDNYNGAHILVGRDWLSDKEIELWEKVEK